MTLRAINFKYIAIEWNKPKSYGDALITGYKVFVNGVVEAALGPDQFSYSYTQGKWCREYIFQVQVSAGAGAGAGANDMAASGRLKIFTH